MTVHAKGQAVFPIAVLASVAMLLAGPVQACSTLTELGQVNAVVAGYGHDHSALADSAHQPTRACTVTNDTGRAENHFE